VGGPTYLRSLKVPLPQVALIASGGVNQLSAFNFILAGATALGIGSELMPHEAVHRRHEGHIQELARRFLKMVKDARAQHQELRAK
jgi:2-dehydro-3-deoxyphosphogluconate aldolase / (4S)-4-hydroxy-2-oxoglutarate aldolase